MPIYRPTSPSPPAAQSGLGIGQVLLANPGPPVDSPGSDARMTATTHRCESPATPSRCYRGGWPQPPGRMLDINKMTTLDKTQSSCVEEAGVNTIETSSLSEQHQAYLLQRHGTIDLDPIPSMDPADPYNWPQWKASEINS